MNRTIKALLFTGPNVVEFGEFELPECRPDEVIVRTLYSTISTGTDLRVLSGRQQIQGDAPYYPVIPGYSAVGEIVEVGSNATGWRVGDLVSGRNPERSVVGPRATWGGHASYHAYPATGYCQPILLPAGARPLDYAFVELAAISHRGARAVAARRGESAIVVGQGTIGALSAAWLVAAGARVAVADLAENRLKRALRYGVSATFSAQDPTLAERLTAYFAGGADIVVESSGSMGAVKLAGSLVRHERITAPGDAIAWPRLLFQASYVDQLPISPTSFFAGEGALVLAPGDRQPADRNAAVEAFRTRTLNPEAFLDHIVPYREAPTAYEGLRLRPNDYFSVVFDWAGA
jgi:2-desacetyl-2-hydroxyethyl bacteriochlorophyllide A dehydrogenase